MSIFETQEIVALAKSPYALLILSLLSFTESSSFVIPPEVLLIPLAIASPDQAIFLGIITSVTSVLGALFGYWIGVKGGKPILNKLFSQERIEKVKILYHKYDAWAILIAAFTPIPFKLATIAAGTFDINLKRFTIAATIGRTTRYMLISVLIYIFGEPIKYFIENQLNEFLAVGTLALIALVLLKKYAMPKINKLIFKESLIEKATRFFSKKR